MQCSLCQRTNSHQLGCPYYPEPKPLYYCSLCNQGIFDEEEYVQNDDGDYSHLDCFDNMKSFADWLGYCVRKMDYGEE